MLTFLGGGRGCAGALTRPSTRHLLPKNFEKTALRRRVGIFTVKMRGGHIYGNDCTFSFNLAGDEAMTDTTSTHILGAINSGHDGTLSFSLWR